MNGQLTQLRPPTNYELFAEAYPVYKVNKKRKRNRELWTKLHKFVELFEYLPGFVDLWLEYMECLRYDSITLDYMRMNRELDGKLTELEWIVVGSEAKLAMFSREGVLQVQYQIKEYHKFIDSEFRPRVTMNTAHLDEGAEAPSVVRALQKLELLDLVNSVVFYQDEDSASEETILQMVANLEALRGLESVRVVGQMLFERVVNFHGVRDHPGRTIGYVVRKRVSQLLVERCASIGGKRNIADFTRWDHVSRIKLSKVRELDLTRTMLPLGCRWLRLENIDKLKWWEQRTVEAELPESCLVCSNPPRAGEPAVWQVDRAAMGEEVLLRCQALLWEIYGRLSCLQLINVREIDRAPVVPRAWRGARFYCWRSMVSRITFV
ncbi:Ctf13p [Lachancea thermotolerans CBS 6340]|uniref:KLTH0D05302p n=1 Tax=Lachancea thermotolerans (strain ATCC 56472 / CBS 6340 / NRRL Y-8284) TaxID=559295 RepID=C5DGH2_LACTC|nr:KLTH0D05302p [Lachancea thermotolerans CBS 6340]CAR22514.1 KLTH0D05302p [Lachancea thermotolerans CBS 6340]